MLLTSLQLTSGSAQAQFSLDEIVKNLRSGNKPDSDAAQAFSRYQSEKNQTNLAVLARLANQDGHMKAKNYMGCIYANGIGIAPDPVKAWQYFRAASTLPIAQHNLAIIYSSKGDRAMAKTLFNNAWRSGGYQESGVWLMSILAKEGADHKDISIPLEAVGNYIASYYVAKDLYQQGNFDQAITKADYSASRMFSPASSLLSEIYFKRVRSAGPSNTESTVREWMAQGYQYLFMADMVERRPLPTIAEYKAKYDIENDIVKSGFTKAFYIMKDMGPADRTYLLPLCEPKKIVQHKNRSK